MAEDIHLAQCLAHFLLDAEQHGDVLETVQSIRDEEGHDDHIRCRGELVPLSHKRCLLHVSIHHLGKAIPAFADQLHLILDGLGAVLVQAGAMPHDDEAGLSARHSGSHFIRTLEQQLRHVRVDAHRIAVVNDAIMALGRRPIQPKLTRQHLLAEVTLADEVRHDVDLATVHGLKHLAHVRLLLPEAAHHLPEQPALADGIGMLMRRSTGVRIHRGTMTDDDEGGVGIGRGSRVQGGSGYASDLRWIPRNYQRFHPISASNRFRLTGCAVPSSWA